MAAGDGRGGANGARYGRTPRAPDRGGLRHREAVVPGLRPIHRDGPAAAGAHGLGPQVLPRGAVQRQVPERHLSAGPRIPEVRATGPRLGDDPPAERRRGAPRSGREVRRVLDHCVLGVLGQRDAAGRLGAVGHGCPGADRVLVPYRHHHLRAGSRAQRRRGEVQRSRAGRARARTATSRRAGRAPGSPATSARGGRPRDRRSRTVAGSSTEQSAGAPAAGAGNPVTTRATAAGRTNDRSRVPDGLVEEATRRRLMYRPASSSRARAGADGLLGGGAEVARPAGPRLGGLHDPHPIGGRGVGRAGEGDLALTVRGAVALPDPPVAALVPQQLDLGTGPRVPSLRPRRRPVVGRRRQ